MAEVIKLRPRMTSDQNDTSPGRQSMREIISSNEPDLSRDQSVKESISSERSTRGYISAEDLYPERDTYNPILSAAMKLLEESLGHINEAIKMLVDGDRISSDDALQKFQALLPELFCCRSLGDGFGSIIISVFQALNNLNGNPLNKSQLISIRNVIRRIHSEPYIEYDEAVEQIMNFESEGFEVTLPSLKYVSDLLNE